LRDRVFDQTEDGVEVDGKSVAPLLVGHFVDGYVFGGPDAVVGDENIEASEMLDGWATRARAESGSAEIAGDCVAVCCAAFFG
jgi:hypothetical protein